MHKFSNDTESEVLAVTRWVYVFVILILHNYGKKYVGSMSLYCFYWGKSKQGFVELWQTGLKSTKLSCFLPR